MILRVIPWLTLSSTLAGSWIGVAEEAIVVAGLLAVRADVGRHLAAAPGLYALACVFSDGQLTAI